MRNASATVSCCSPTGPSGAQALSKNFGPGPHCGLVGFSFLQAAALYGEANSSARESPVLASSLSPLDGILVPTLGGFYLGVTLLFPFVAIRVISNEKETGALRLLMQLPYNVSTLCATKLAAVLFAWAAAGVPA